MKNIDSQGHVRGTSLYLDDIPLREGTLHCAVFSAPIAHGRITKLNAARALKKPGVVAILTAADIPGDNQIGGIIPDEPLLTQDDIHFQGQPIALVIATTDEQARAARKAIQLEFETLPPVVDPREAREKGKLIIPPRTFQIGDVDAAWSHCSHIFSGRAESGGQEHLYIETQGAYAYLAENGHLRIHSSTQGPTAVQRTAARVLGVPMHKIEVDVTRLGGGFGGKEDQATPWAVMAGLAAHHLKRPVKLVLHRMDDMRMTGKRHPYSSDFKIGLDADFKILAYEATFHQDAGAAADLSPAVMERTLFHCTNSYFIPNVKATAYSCKTNVPPNTAFRGFGGPQGMFVIEAAIATAAEALGIPAAKIQKRNLLNEGDAFPYGQKTKDCLAGTTWEALEERHNLEALRKDIAAFNRSQPRYRQGLALMPICFGISFTKTHMNQASALVHIYQDGSVGVSTGAVEMGQGVNTKILQVVAHTLGIPADRIKLETTNTTRVANTSPTAASAGADLNGKAAGKACHALSERLLDFAADTLKLPVTELRIEDGWVLHDDTRTEWDWQKLVTAAFLNRIQLSQHAQYETPGIHFDATIEKGEPFAYHVYGTAAIIAQIDRLLGIYTIEAVHLVHDGGKTISHSIDLGQIEGGLVQGIGWMTMEEVVYDRNGRLLANALSTYKVPGIHSVPKTIGCHFLESGGSPHAVLKSKAVGEPPLMYGIGAYFAIRAAIRAANPKADFPFSAPITPEKVLLALYPHKLKPGAPRASSEDTVIV